MSLYKTAMMLLVTGLLVAPSAAAQEAPRYVPKPLPGMKRHTLLPRARPTKAQQPVAKPLARPVAKQPVAEPAKPVEPTTFRWAGEELYYSVRLNGVEAVRAGVRTGDVRYKDGHPYVAVAGTAQSTGIFHNIYPVNDRAHTYVNPVTLRPMRSEKFFEEAGSERSYHVDFVHSTYRAKVRKEKKDKKTRKFTKAIPGTTNDMMTWFYELRNKQDLEIGERLSYYVYDGWRLYKLEAHVVKREDVYTPLGWFKAYKIDFTRTSLRSRHNRGSSPVISVAKPATPSGSLWVSRDENLIPVKVEVVTQWGVGEALLIKYKLPKK